MFNPEELTYLGDGVYVKIERNMVKLTTNNGIEDTNTIFLEPEVFNALTNWESIAVEFYKSQREHALADENNS